MTGIADLVSITFDLRALQMEQLTQQAQMGINPQMQQMNQQMEAKQ